MAPQTVLVLDTASPVVSLAVARDGEVLADATLELRRTSERLLVTVRDTLEAADCTLQDLSGVAALQGPGSFTGLRIGLATVLGWHQGLQTTATAIPTLPTLALASTRHVSGDQVVGAVNAMRGDWMVQTFRLADDPLTWPTAMDSPRLVSEEAFYELSPYPVVGFELPPSDDLQMISSPPLAPVAARWLSTVDRGEDATWQAHRLIEPIYFRPPAVTLPRPRTFPRSKALPASKALPDSKILPHSKTP